jgi:hypothetical protein
MSVNTFILGGIPVDLGELAFVDYSHNKIHEGKMFTAHYYAGTVAGDGTLLFSVTAGTVAPHLLFDIGVGGDARVRITEGGTIASGTAVTVFNMRRNAAGSCLSTCQHSGVLTGGTVISDLFVAGGVGPNSAGGGARANHEFMALTSKTTTIELVNVTSAYPASIGVVFYEDNEDD